MPGNNPSLVKESLWQTPQACTLIRTCIGPGSGMSRSTISKGALGLDTCTERMYNYVLLAIYLWYLVYRSLSRTDRKNSQSVLNQFYHLVKLLHTVSYLG